MKTILPMILIVLSATRIAAQETNSVPDDELTNRLDFIQQALDDGQKAADLWWYGWLVGYSAATAGQTAIYATTDDDQLREDLLIGAITSALGAAGQIVFPLHAGRLAPRLRNLPADTPEQRRAKLTSAEGFLKKAAAEEAYGRSWKSQLTSIAVNLAAGATAWLYFDHSATDGLVTFAIGQLVSEVQIFSQPMKAVHDLRAYEARTDFTRRGPTRTPRASWSLRLSATTLAIGCTF